MGSAVKSVTNAVILGKFAKTLAPNRKKDSSAVADAAKADADRLKTVNNLTEKMRVEATNIENDPLKKKKPTAAALSTQLGIK